MIMEDWDIEKEVPLKVGEHIKLKLLGTGGKGDIYGKHKGLVVFVKGVTTMAPQEVITVEITDVKQRCAFGKKV
jgi:predicted RNA-binding protein with TRAM domain